MDKYLHPLYSVGWKYSSVPKLQRLQRWNLEMDKWFYFTLYWACDYLSVLGFKLIHVTKRGPRSFVNDAVPHCGILTPFVALNLGHRWLRWLLIARWHQTIIWPKVNLPLKVFCCIPLRVISQEVLINLISYMRLEVTTTSSWGQWWLLLLRVTSRDAAVISRHCTTVQ